jgi:hypothetical protein
MHRAGKAVEKSGEKAVVVFTGKICEYGIW